MKTILSLCVVALFALCAYAEDKDDIGDLLPPEAQKGGECGAKCSDKWFGWRRKKCYNACKEKDGGSAALDCLIKCEDSWAFWKVNKCIKGCKAEHKKPEPEKPVATEKPEPAKPEKPEATEKPQPEKPAATEKPQ